MKSEGRQRSAQIDDGKAKIDNREAKLTTSKIGEG